MFYLARAFVGALGMAALSNVGCQSLLEPAPWQRYYDARYPHHRIAHELCAEQAKDEASYSACMQDSILPHDRTVSHRTSP